MLPQTPSHTKVSVNNTYLVVGGLGGLGRAIIRFFATLGAKHIAILSRSGAESDSQKAFVKEMSDAGVNLIVHQGSVVNIEDIIEGERANSITAYSWCGPWSDGVAGKSIPSKRR